MEFKLTSDFIPTGDQPDAIKQLVEGINRGDKAQTLLGVTGSGKTFTVANIIQQVQKPTLILSHNKTLAAQLYSEFKLFFPENAVEYFVSYYDYYQPEAFIPSTNTYIEKDLSINDEIEKFRLSTSSALLSARKDVIVVASVSCIYGIGNPADFYSNIITIKKGEKLSRNKLLLSFVGSLYSRTEGDFSRGNFRVKGDTVEIYPAYLDYAFRIIFFGDEIESIESFDVINAYTIDIHDEIIVYPANIFVTSPDKIKKAIYDIQDDLVKQIAFLKDAGKHLEAKRLEDRVTYDMEMMRELGYCSGIENYSRYFDGRAQGSRPFCLIDYFPDDFLLVVDESHATIPQVRAMYGGDRSRKQNLVEYGFRLPSAMDNRPLKFDEFEAMINQIVFVSATPADYELQLSDGVVVEQLIRPTGLLDPMIEVRPSLNQVDDLLDEIEKVTARNERTLVTTLTKRMAEELAKYFANIGIRCRYIHSEVHTLERIEILNDLRAGSFDVLIGVNLIREGLDLPEVSLVAILDADKEGFLRSERSLTQTSGRAARNVNSIVIMYADKITHSMQMTIDSTNRKREKQIKYNLENNITPTTIFRSADKAFGQSKTAANQPRPYIESDVIGQAAEPVLKYLSKEQLQKSLQVLKSDMNKAVKALDFIEAAKLRDEMFEIEKLIDTKSQNPYKSE
ncbi:MAG: excinuclease ABC subunit UvrB [Bacteroidetes bacterium]|nr:excinuclease ABC subunit UvrB [Bacteroidota bacterium]